MDYDEYTIDHDEADYLARERERVCRGCAGNCGSCRLGGGAYEDEGEDENESEGEERD